MAEKISFTMAALAKLRPPETGRQYHWDVKTPGLALCVTASGSRSFYWVKKVAGRAERIRLGGFPEISVDAARQLAAGHNSSAAKGSNPADAKRLKRGELTIGELFELYLEFRAVPHKKPRSVAEDRALYSRYLTGWKDRKLSSIENGDVRTLHARIGKANGKYAANRMLSLLSTMFTTAADHGQWKHVNPCRGVKHFAEQSRDRFLQPDEVGRFFAALDSIDNQTAADAFRLMLWTGARKSNVLGMRWEDVDIPSATWRIPDTKANEPQRAHLAPEATAILSRLKAKADDGAVYVFPARTAGAKAGHLQHVVKPWDEVRAAAEMPGLRMHDLRRSLGSWMAAGGASLPIIGKTLGHHNQATTAVYARLNIDPVRAAVDGAVNAMLATSKPKPALGNDDAPLGVG